MSNFAPIRDCKHGHQKGKCDSCDLEQAEKIIEQQQQQIAELEQRNNGLTATIERLRKTISKLDGNIVSAWEWVCIFNKLRAVSELTPQQNLNAVKRASFIAGYTAGNGYPPSDWEVDQYIKSIKDGEL